MTRLPAAPSRRLRTAMASLLLCGTTSTFALDTATIVSSAVSPNCLEYRVVGICYWLYCTWTGCTVRTSVKVRHYIPDAVVSSCSNTGENPWVEVRAMSMPNPTAQAGGDGTTNHDNENNLESCSSRSLEQRQAHRAEAAPEAQGDMGHPHPFADGPKHPGPGALQSCRRQ